MTKKKKRGRRGSRPTLEDLAIRIDSSATWNDLALPKRQILILKHVATHFRKETSGHGQRRFATRSTAVFGPGALFLGQSCTGKTMAAGVLGTELHVDVYRIDLSQLVCRHVGETEKNLRQVFDAAENSGAILFFDEADALFEKRGEVKDSHNRYANIEISYLLERIEAYSGLVILAANSKDELDETFLRRFRFIVNFPTSDAALTSPRSSCDPILISCKGDKKQYSTQFDKNGTTTVRFWDSSCGQTPVKGSEIYGTYRNSRSEKGKRGRCMPSSSRPRKRLS